MAPLCCSMEGKTHSEVVREEMTHNKVGTHNAHTDEGSLPLVEYKCDAESNYTVVREGSTYCPLCGYRLER